MDDWAIRYPTNTEDVSRVLLAVSKLYLDARDKQGSSISTDTSSHAPPLPQILHFSSEDRRTKYQICEILAEILGLSLARMEPDRPDPEDRSERDGVVRPYDCHLDTKVLKDLGVDVSTMDFVGWW